jgi:KipI family sensor histidine kinase inhibitor
MSAVTGVRRAGERAAVLDVAVLDVAVLDVDVTPAAVAAAIHQLAAATSVTLAEVVPGAATVLVVAADPSQLLTLLARLPELATHLAVDSAPGSADIVEIPVRYDGPDLAAVASATRLSVEDVIRLHSAATYEAAFTGFAPGFAYLTGLDPRLVLPRRSTPRPSVPAGSLAIADVYTAVYPRSSPGGWHLIGTTDTELFDTSRTPPALLVPGSLVRFVEVSP